jgi:hypothetical protein
MEAITKAPEAPSWAWARTAFSEEALIRRCQSLIKAKTGASQVQVVVASAEAEDSGQGPESKHAVCLPGLPRITTFVEENVAGDE